MLADSVLQGRYAEPEWSIHLILTSTMATKAKTAAKKAKKAATAQKPAATAVSVKPLKDTFTKSSLVSHLAEQAQVDAKAVKAVLLHLENTITGALHKKGAGEFTLPGLFKVTSVKVPATKRRFGKNPFTGLEQWFEAKPATVRVKVRALKKVKDAALNG
jgi:nucleoid DNA-binding protein